MDRVSNWGYGGGAGMAGVSNWGYEGQQAWTG